MRVLIKNYIIPMIRIISFSIVFIFLITYLSYISKPDFINLFNLGGYYSEKNPIDVVYVGGSAGFVYYEPLRAWEKYGIISYDYGVNTVQAECYKMMIKEVLKTQSPELIIIDARPFQYREDKSDIKNNPSEVAYRNVLTSLKLSKNKKEFIDEYVKEVDPEGNNLSYYFDVIKYHGVKFDDKSDSKFKMIFNKYDNENKGFYFVEKHQALKQSNFMTNEKTELPEKSEELLVDLLDYLKTTNQKYMFVVSPYVEEEYQKKMFNTVEDKIAEYGYEFLDFNEYTKDMNIDYSTDFYNINHVNIFGADKYTDYLSEYLLKNYNISTHKEDEKYQYWNDYLPKWNENVNKTKNAISKIIEESNGK